MLERHPWIGLLIILALFVVVGTMDYNDAVRGAM